MTLKKMKNKVSLKYILVASLLSFLCGIFMPSGCDSEIPEITPDRTYDSLSRVSDSSLSRAKAFEDIAASLEKKAAKLEGEKKEIQKRYDAYKSRGREVIQTACPDSEQALNAYDDLAARCDSIGEVNEQETKVLWNSISTYKTALAEKDTAIGILELKFDLKNKDAEALEKNLKKEKRLRLKSIVKTILAVVAVEAVAIGTIIGITQLKK